MALPCSTLVARPAALIVATASLEDVQVAEFVKSCALPSVKVPVAVNCWVCPLAINGLAGVTDRETRAAAPTVSDAEPVMLSDTALMLAVPGATELSRPAAVIVATAGFVDVQKTDAVRSLALPSLKRPVAANCCWEPFGSEMTDGVTLMETSVDPELPDEGLLPQALRPIDAAR